MTTQASTKISGMHVVIILLTAATGEELQPEYFAKHLQ